MDLGLLRAGVFPDDLLLHRHFTGSAQVAEEHVSIGEHPHVLRFLGGMLPLDAAIRSDDGDFVAAVVADEHATIERLGSLGQRWGLEAVRHVVVVTIQGQRVVEVLAAIAIVVATGLEPCACGGRPFLFQSKRTPEVLRGLGAGEAARAVVCQRFRHGQAETFQPFRERGACGFTIWGETRRRGLEVAPGDHRLDGNAIRVIGWHIGIHRLVVMRPVLRIWQGAAQSSKHAGEFAACHGLIGLEEQTVRIGLPDAAHGQHVCGFKVKIVGREIMPGPEQDARTASAAHEAQLQFTHLRHIAGGLTRLDAITQTQPGERGSCLAHVHHLAVQADRGLHDAADTDVFARTDQALHLHGHESTQWEGGAIRVRVPAARGCHDVAPRAVARSGDKAATSGMKVDVKLVAEDAVCWQHLGPHRLASGGADVLLAQHVESFEAQPFADVGLRRQTIRRAELVRELHVAKGLREVAHAIMHGCLQMIQHTERMLLHVIEDDPALRGREFDDVLLRCARLRLFQRIHDTLRELAQRIILGGIVQKGRLGARRETIVPAIHETTMRVRAVAAR